MSDDSKAGQQRPNSLGEMESADQLQESPNTGGDLPDPIQTSAPLDEADAWIDPEVQK